MIATIKKIITEIERRQKIIAKERDALRKLESVLRDVIDPLDDADEHLIFAIQDLELAIDSLSEQQ